MPEAGIRHPLDVLPDGTILDGRHRYRMAREIGLLEVPVRVLDLSEDEAVEHIYRCGCKRRNLGKGQIAVMSVEMAKWREERKAAADRQKAAARAQGHHGAEGGRGHVKPSVATLPPRVKAPTPPAPPPPKTRTLMATETGVSERTIQKAITLDAAAQKSPAVAALVPKVKDGSLTVEEALKVAKAPEEQRDRVAQAVLGGTKVREALFNEAKQKVAPGLWSP